MTRLTAAEWWMWVQDRYHSNTINRDYCESVCGRWLGCESVIHYTLNTESFPPLCSKQGHLTRFLSYGLGLNVTAIEADRTLVAMASKFDGQLVWSLEKEKQKKVGALLDV